MQDEHGTAVTTSTTGDGTTTRARWSLVALGDSVPNGANCSCNPYPGLLAEGMSAQRGKQVRAINDAAGGFTTADVLDQLTNDRNVIAHVRAADVITIEIGANDVSYSKSCGNETCCYEPDVPAMRKGLTAILARIKALTAGRTVPVVLLDYWSIWLGGKYAAAQGADYVAAADKMTDEVNTVIKSLASATKSSYVDLRAAFKGPSYSDDETQFLSNDGDHPSAYGHRQIARATQRVLTRALRG